MPTVQTNLIARVYLIPAGANHGWIVEAAPPGSDEGSVLGEFVDEADAVLFMAAKRAGGQFVPQYRAAPPADPPLIALPSFWLLLLALLASLGYVWAIN